MADKNAKLILNGKEIEFPVKSGSIGPDVVDIATLYKHTGAFTYDPGFTSTASCESKITYPAAIRSTSSPSKAISWRSATCCSTANCRQPPRRPISTTA